MGFNLKGSNNFVSAGFAPIIYFSNSQSIFIELGISAVINLEQLEIKTEEYRRVPIYTDKGLCLGNNISLGVKNERAVLLLGAGFLFL